VQAAAVATPFVSGFDEQCPDVPGDPISDSKGHYCTVEFDNPTATGFLHGRNVVLFRDDGRKPVLVD
jgi:hypothetical protein